MSIKEELKDSKIGQDFDGLDINDCILVKKFEKNDNTYTFVGLWQYIMDLKKVLFDVNNYSLFITGANIYKEDDRKFYRVYEGTVIDNDYITVLSMEVSTVLMQYKQWKETRNRLFNGSEGAFYDFDELSGIINDISVLCNITNYIDLYNVIMSLIIPWTKTNNTLDRFINENNNILQTKSYSEGSANFYVLMNKLYALNDLKHNRLFKIQNLSFILCKLSFMCDIERRISKIRKEAFIDAAE